MTEDRRSLNSFERHAQTGLTLVLVALLVWVGSTTQTTQIKLAELAVEVKNLKDVFRTPNSRMNDLTSRIELIEKHVLTDRIYD